jgi:hypothetical protein
MNDEYSVSKYQKADYEIIDYGCQSLENILYPVRGPLPPSLGKDQFIVCTGAAQTFGRFVEKPYPLLLQERLAVPVLNLSQGGIGAAQYRRLSESYLPYLNRAKFVVVQVVTGRNEPNSLFDLARGEPYHLVRRSDSKSIEARFLYKDLLASGDRKLINRVLEETKLSWIDNFTFFLKQIRVPKILFWFSKRKPQYEVSFKNINRLFGHYPQLVTDEWIAPLLPHVDEYVECITGSGSPQPLVSRFDGQSVTITGMTKKKTENNYYPSPEMHQDAADALYATCLKYLQKG